MGQKISIVCLSLAGGEGESGAKGEGGDTGTQVTEEKIEDDPSKVEQTEDMELD